MTRFNHNKFFVLLAASVLLTISFLGFRSLNYLEKDRIRKNLNALLRSETAVSNSYAVSKIIADFESIDAIKCARLEELGEQTRIFYNTIDIKKCNLPPVKFRIQTENLKALNGLSYQLTYVPSLNIYAISLEVVSYLIIIILGLIILNYLENKTVTEKLKFDLLQNEKAFIANRTKQVTHDIASPLSSLRMMVSLLNNIDPEIRQILESSVQRTAEIVEDLKKHNDDTINFCPSSCMLEIVNEKKMIYKNCNFEVEKNMIDVKLMGSPSKFKRVLSNLINNAYESIEHAQGTIKINQFTDGHNYNIWIVDNGLGMSDETLKKLGSEGFSLGKIGHKTAGSGLGVSYCRFVITQMNGLLKYESKLGNGTITKLSVPFLKN